jgi:ubiquinone/menaquinone biosynthesis C-methylase UbiE
MKYDYLNFFEKKLKELAKGERILDVGGGEPFQKGMARYKDWFVGKKYETLDVAPEYNPTIVGDIHNLPLEGNSIDAILCKSVLEHLYDPKRAVEEMHRVLKDGGRILVYTHFIYPYHARKNIYGDYFRFTEDSLKYLFRDFSQLEIKKEGGYFRAMMFFMPFQAKLKFLLEPVTYFLDRLFRTERRTTTAGYYIYAVK